MSTEDLQKWIDASVKATKLKFALEDILTNNFSHEEMESVKYKQLVGTIDQYLEHVMGAFRKEKEEKLRKEYEAEIEKLKKENDKFKKENERLKKGASWWNIKSASIAGIGAIILELVKFLFGFFKGS